MPDFGALSAGTGGVSQVNGGAGQSSVAGSMNPPGGSSSSGAGSGGAPISSSGSSGAAPIVAGGGGGGADGGLGGDDGSGGEAAAGGASGAGGESPCGPPAPGLTAYATFDDGLTGTGFVETALTNDISTTMGATGSFEWDPNAGSGCPGAVHFSYAFKGYASGTANDERGTGTYYFKSINWSGYRALHAKVKVSPAGAPLAGLLLFAMSGQDYRFYGVFDGSDFASGQWHEMILEPVAGASYDPTNVHRLGVQATLQRADAAGGKALPSKIDIWLDDIWLEPK